MDANASKGHLDDVARRVGIDDPQNMNKGELVDAIEKANARATAQARRR
ncbi:hypothetical protein [Micromonospora sp. D93]